MAEFSDCDPYAILDGCIEVELNPETEDELDMIKRVTSWLSEQGLLDYDSVKDYVWDNFDWDEKSGEDEEL